MKTDMHTHVLPGVDHGAVDWDMSLQMLVKSAECGVEAVIATPHYLPWKEGVTAEVICELCEEAKERLQKEYGISMDIYPGNEIYYSSETVELLKTGKVLTLAGTQYVLIEFQQEVPYQMLCKAARDLRFHGYIPIFAHIERYFCVDNIEKLIELKEMGALLQVNVGAFQGGLFDAKSRKVKKWLKKGIIDFVASDMHDMKERPPMSNDRLEWFQKKLELQYQDKLLYGNAQDILTSMKV
ncbi:MAG: protein tyrosine phosphatase [Tyzzerella sp.]|nr:protein tyrosine phosphatase [Tyzzerella sp.]